MEIINANNPVASDKAKPSTAYPNRVSLRDTFLATAVINEPKTVPIPTPAPAKPIAAEPAPIALADCNNIIIDSIYDYKLTIHLYSIFSSILLYAIVKALHCKFFSIYMCSVYYIYVAYSIVVYVDRYTD